MLYKALNDLNGGFQLVDLFITEKSHDLLYITDVKTLASAGS